MHCKLLIDALVRRLVGLWFEATYRLVLGWEGNPMKDKQPIQTISFPLRVLSLPPSRKHLGCSWSCVHVYKWNSHRGWVLNLMETNFNFPAPPFDHFFLQSANIIADTSDHPQPAGYFLKGGRERILGARLPIQVGGWGIVTPCYTCGLPLTSVWLFILLYSGVWILFRLWYF